MALLCRIDGYDLSGYLQAAVDDFDPARAFSEPQFAGNSLTDGDLFISITRHNREWTLPVLIVADSNDALNATVRTINSHLRQGVTLEYREDGASNSTYFDVETAVLEADYRYQRNRQGVGKFLLKVWTRPLGHTGTTRLVASALGTQGFAMMPIASMGLVGDADPRLTLGITTASPNQFSGLIWGVAAPSDCVINTVGSMLMNSNASYFAVGTNAVVPTVFKQVPAITTLHYVGATYTANIPTAMLGRSFRMVVGYQPWAQASANADIGSARWYVTDGNLQTTTGPRVGLHSLPSMTDAGEYCTVDLGVCSLPSAGALSVAIELAPTNTVATYVLASTLWHIESLDMISVDYFGVANHPSAGPLGVTSATVNQSCMTAAYGSADKSWTTAMRGALPALPVGMASSTFVMRSIHSPDPGGQKGRSRTFTVGAKEQFQFFR